MSTMITGGTGFLGSYLARLLIDKGITPVLYDIAPPHGALKEIEGNYEFVRGSLTNLSEILNCVREHSVDTIFHLGGLLSLPSEENPWSAFDINLLGTYKILEASRLEGVKKVIFGSTIATFSNDIETATVNDFSVQHPNSMYGTTKVMCETIGRYYAIRFGIDFRSIRIPSVVGPGAKTPHMSIYNCWAIEESLKGNPYVLFCEPETKVAVIYFKDAARALMMLADADEKDLPTRVYNIKGVAPYTADDLVTIIRKRIPGAQLRFESDPTAVALLKRLGQLEFTDERAHNEWGWTSSYDLTAMVDDFIQEFKEHRSWYE